MHPYLLHLKNNMLEKKALVLPYDLLDMAELELRERSLLAEAAQARKHAYAPYTKFRVGAAIRTNDGAVVNGWNVEDIVQSGLHAENAALGRLTVENRAAGLEMIAVVGGPEDSLSEEIVTPCGHCRQRLLEVLRPDDDPVIVMSGTRGRIMRAALRDLLPMAFYPAILAPQK